MLNKLKNSTFIVFLISFLVSLIIIGSLALFYYQYIGKHVEVKLQKIEYEKDEASIEQNLTTIIFGCEKIESPLSLALLLEYKAVERSMAVKVIPITSESTVDVRTDTIAGHYDYSGINGAKKAIENMLSVEINRYVRLPKVGIANIIDIFGGIDYNNTLMDGMRTAEFMLDTTNDNIQQEVLISKLINDSITPVIKDRYKVFTKAVFFNGETNLNEYDFAFREYK